uniref:Uncharacterized protein n=1 Tax=Arundo donax TaxID=35708 RepID=A0A0A9TKF7_ARUDO
MNRLKYTSALDLHVQRGQHMHTQTKMSLLKGSLK